MWCNTPAASDYTALSRETQEAVIQRHTPCQQCSCKGVRQDLDSGLCACAHEHLLPEDEKEFVRRLKVAVRIDELLQDKSRLQDFQFEDEDIESLRQQMIPPRNEGSSPPLHGKRRHVDSASQEPQAKRIKSSSELGDLPKKLSKYYTTPSVKPSVVEEQDGLIQFRVVNNDNAPMSMIILTGLKNIFQKQLPKMPREYIARLIYDRNHLSLAIVRGVSTGKIEVIGGITYRPFNHRRFAEIVFCAIASSEQVRGYGAHLMNHLKDYVKASSPIIHFLTYADNYAIGYFKKQGFTKEINLDRSVWVGYIKDYEGGTIMQCTMLPRIRYLESGDIMARQKAAVLWKIAETSNDHVVYPGIEAFRKGRSIDPAEIPGLKETGWSREMDEQARKPKRPGHYATLQALLLEMQNSPAAWPFVNPVSREDVPDYYEVIKEPMDLTSMEFKLENDQYENVEQFIYDAKLIFNNCRSYNNETTTYYKNSTKLEKVLRDIIKEKHDEYLNLL